MRIILFILLPFFSVEVFAETLYFDVVRNDKTIGELTAKQYSNAGHITYTTTTQINTRIIKYIEVYYQFVVTMSRNYLNTADALITVNGKIRDHTLTYKEGSNYCIQSDNRVEQCLSKRIDYPVILLMFKEPVNVSKAYSEINGEFHSISSLGNQSYQKTNLKGNSDCYYYENGKLQFATIDAGLFQFEIILRE